MNFRTTLGLGISAVLILIAWQAMAAIIAALTVAATVAFWWVIIVGTGGVIYVGTMYWLREQDARNRYIDGQAPLREIRLKGGRRVLVDINSTVGGIIDIDPVQGVIERTPAAGWDLQQQHNAVVQTTRSLAAIIPGDAAQVRTHGAISAPKLGESVTKLLTKAQPVHTPVASTATLPDPVAPVIVRQPVTPQQMIAGPQSTKLAIGESVDSGEIVFWDVTDTPFVRVHGTTGSGKTALCKMLVAQAVRHGWEVTILDTRKGKDWGTFRNHARLVDARQPAVALEEIRREIARYENRDAILGKYGAADVVELQRITGKSYRRRLLVVEEVQSHHINAEDLGTEWREQFWRAMGKLTKDARATGIHGLYIDQMPTEWTKGVRYNSESICFRLPDYGGRVAGYLYAHQLAQFHCHFDGKIIKAGHLSEAQILATIGNATPKKALSGENDTQNGVLPPAEVTITPDNTPQPGKWDDFARLFYVNNPNAGQRDLTRAMAATDPDKRPPEAFLGKLSSDLYHTYSPKGKMYIPPTLPTEER